MFKLLIKIAYISLLLFIFSLDQNLGIILFLGSLLLYLIFNPSNFLAALGNIFLYFNNYKIASFFFKRISKSAGFKLQYENKLAYCLIRQNKFSEAEDIFNSLFSRKLDENLFSSTRINYAILLWKESNLNSAISILYQVRKNTESTQLYELLGLFLIMNKNYEEALTISSKAYDYNFESERITCNLGESYYYLGNYKESNKILSRLINKNSKYADCYYYFGLSLIEMYEKKSAKIWFEKALSKKIGYFTNITLEQIEKDYKYYFPKY